MIYILEVLSIVAMFGLLILVLLIGGGVAS